MSQSSHLSIDASGAGNGADPSEQTHSSWSQPLFLTPNSLALHVPVQSSVFASWSDTQQRAWNRRFVSPSHYFSNFVHPNIKPARCNKSLSKFSVKEHYSFLAALSRLPAPCDWSAFSLLLPGRNGTECRKYFKLCRDAGFVTHKGYVKQKSSLISKARSGHVLLLKRVLKKFVPPRKLLPSTDDFWLKDIGDGMPNQSARFEIQAQVNKWLDTSYKQYCIHGCFMSLTSNDSEKSVAVHNVPTLTVSPSKRITFRRPPISKKRKTLPVISVLKIPSLAKKVHNASPSNDISKEAGEHSPFSPEPPVTDISSGTDSSCGTASLCTTLDGDIDASDMSPPPKRGHTSVWQADSSDLLTRNIQSPLTKMRRSQKKWSDDNCKWSKSRYVDESEYTHGHELNLRMSRTSLDAHGTLDLHGSNFVEQVNLSPRPNTLEPLQDEEILQHDQPTPTNSSDIDYLIRIVPLCGHHVQCTRELIKFLRDEDRDCCADDHEQIKRIALLQRFDGYVARIVAALKYNGRNMESITAQCRTRMHDFLQEMDELQRYQDQARMVRQMTQRVMC